MKHNQLASDFRFVCEPIEFSKFTEKALLQYCLGATLYMPGTKDITEKVLTCSFEGLTSMVMCFEDAIGEGDVSAAEDNVLRHLSALAQALADEDIAHEDIPLTFLRVRNTSQFRRFSQRLTPEQGAVLSGFVFPKFYSCNALEYLECLSSLQQRLDTPLYAMPILEGRDIAYIESRNAELLRLKELLNPFKDLILNIRVGGTDFSSLFGVRRNINSSIYNIMTVRDCLSDILNVFNRAGEGYTVSAPVWEYFLADISEDLSHLLEESIHTSLLNQNTIINPAIDGLLREVVSDNANGFVGKTIIHPSHLRFVNSMQTVTREEYEDAQQILNASGGVVKSAQANKMNEINPHRNWAKRISLRAQAYGVIEDESCYLKLMIG
jgi:citrate lyase beta subunit